MTKLRCGSNNAMYCFSGGFSMSSYKSDQSLEHTNKPWATLAPSQLTFSRSVLLLVNLFYSWTHCDAGRNIRPNIFTLLSNVRWLDSNFTSSTGSETKMDPSPYIDDWQSVYGSPINSHFLTCVDRNDLPPSIIVWALRLSALHLLISEAFCSEKGDCQQRIYKREGEQKEAGGVNV